MKQNHPDPVLPYTQSAVLLIFFVPLNPATCSQRALLVQLADSLQEHFGKQLRVLRIDEANHPDVVRCFFIDRTPAFVLVRQGVELWRLEGSSDRDTLVPLIQGLLTT